MLRRRMTWRQQPQSPVDVDRSIAAPVFAVNYAAGIPSADIVTGTVPVASATALSRAVTDAGVGINFPNGVSNVALDYALTAAQKFSADFTFVVVGRFPTGSSNIAVAAICRNAGGTAQLRMQPNFHSGSVTANAFGLLSYDGSAFTNVSAANVITGKTQVFIGRRRGTEHTLWVDGRLVATTSGTVRNVSGATSCVVGNFDQTGVYGAGGPVLSASMYDRALPDSQCALISANPWQIFAP